MQNTTDSSHEYLPANLSIVSYYGVSGVLPEVIDDALFLALSDEQERRARDALREQLSVIPRAKGMYWVVSYSGQEPTKYSINLDTTTCTCEDFMYNCNPETGVVCKHIWRVRYLIQQNALPNPEKNPYNWLTDQLETDRFYLNRIDKQTLADELKKVHDSVKQNRSWLIDYEPVFRRRAEILSNLEDVLSSKPPQTPFEVFD